MFLYVCFHIIPGVHIKKVSEYDQELSQSHTANQPMAP